MRSEAGSDLDPVDDVQRPLDGDLEVRDPLLERAVLVPQQADRVPRDAGILPAAIPARVDPRPPALAFLLGGPDTLDQALEGRQLLR